MPGKRNILLILGMHRSGTSYIAEKVKQLGYASNSSDIEKNNFNPNGYNEEARVVQLHDDLLAHFDRQWGHYQHWLSLPDGWLDDEVTKNAYDQIKMMIEESDLSRTFFKDPRMVLFIDLWKDVLNDLRVNYSTIVVMRNKKSVVKSLVTRDKFSEELAGAIYDYYNYLLVETLAKTRDLAINFEDYAKNEDELLNKLSSFLKIAPSDQTSIFNESLDHSALREHDPKFGAGINLDYPSPALISEAKQYLKEQRQYSTLHSVFKLDSILETGSWRLSTDLKAYRKRSIEMEKAFHKEKSHANLYKKHGDELGKAYEELGKAYEELTQAYEKEIKNNRSLLRKCVAYVKKLILLYKSRFQDRP